MRQKGNIYKIDDTKKTTEHNALQRAVAADEKLQSRRATIKYLRAYIG